MVHVVHRSIPTEWSDPGPISALSPPGYVGHAHFWERALSRREFMRTTAGASALAVAAGMAWPAAAFAESESGSRHNATPRPIPGGTDLEDRKSTRLNSSHQIISYAVFCLKKKKKQN